MPEPQTSSAPSTTAASVADTVWAYVVSIKTMRKRDGREETFDAQKLRASIERSLVDAGLEPSRWADRVTRTVLSRLGRAFNGHTTPTSVEVRDVVGLAFVDHNLIHAAKRYLQFASHPPNPTSGGGGVQPRYGRGITVPRYFTKPGVHPYELLAWERRDARIQNEKGKIIFEQKGVEVPSGWSQTATNVVVSKYFRGKVGDSDRETSVQQLVDRVAKTVADWGRADGYFQSAEDADAFEMELTHILVNQMAAFNSPVWFNVGIVSTPQCSACFINSVQDDMRSILNLAVTEGMLFKGGSGTGSNFSNLRSSREYLGGSNGRASGPISFMKGLDAFAGVIKSGGKTRRAAKMVILNVDHPDIKEFIFCKAEEEKKAWALMDAGYDGSMDGPAYSSIFFQNANNSVRVTDEFMRAVERDTPWITREVTTGKPSESYRARELMRAIAEATWLCGDPGMQFDTTVNNWHTCKATDRIHASNPCSEFMFLDDTACNLASLNLLKFRKAVAAGDALALDVEAFKAANEIVITAMEIIVGNSSYPTPSIEQNSLDYRPLGIGYANLGALLMSRGLAYDSEEGRHLAAAITALQSGHCYAQSAKIAKVTGPFAGFVRNRDSMLGVIRMHRDAAYQIHPDGVPQDLLSCARLAWDDALALGAVHGFRNAQISVIAPTGTISFLMDCDTTGIEPDIALVKYKWLVGGGMIKIVNRTVPEALQKLGYTTDEQKAILAHIDEHDTIEGAPSLRPEHLPVFDCAFRPAKGKRSIHWKGHVRMMAATQPFVSGAISKTVNLPHEATLEDIEEAYTDAWRMGLKAIAIYRDGSKRQQALTTSKEKDSKAANAAPDTVAKGHATWPQTATPQPTQNTSAPVTVLSPVAPIPDRARLRRKRLPDERRSLTHKFAIGSHEGYITVGLYDDGKPGELFIMMAKEGSVISGLMNSFATAISIGLQYGVPLDVLVNKFVHTRFEPSGFTNNSNIRMAKSLVDYIFRWMALKFLSREVQERVGLNLPAASEGLVDDRDHQAAPASAGGTPAGEMGPMPESQPTLFTATLPLPPKGRTEGGAVSMTTFDNQSDAPACDTCGSMMVRNAACYKCLNCGATSGCS